MEHFFSKIPLLHSIKPKKLIIPKRNTNDWNTVPKQYPPPLQKKSIYIPRIPIRNTNDWNTVPEYLNRSSYISGVEQFAVLDPQIIQIFTNCDVTKKDSESHVLTKLKLLPFPNDTEDKNKEN